MMHENTKLNHAIGKAARMIHRAEDPMMMAGAMMAAAAHAVTEASGPDAAIKLLEHEIAAIKASKPPPPFVE